MSQITCVRRRDEDMLLLLASDGLWDVFTNQEARDFAVDKWVQGTCYLVKGLCLW
jgi:protein phosphatase 2C